MGAAAHCAAGCKGESMMRRTLLATGAAALAYPKAARAATSEAKVLVLSCYDFRMQGVITRFMSSQNLAASYNQFTISGGTHGVATNPTWATAFWEHLDLSKTVHKIKWVYLLGHRDCYAYRPLIFDPSDKKLELEVHAKNMNLLRKEIVEKYSDVKIYMYLLSLDGWADKVQSSG